MKIHIDENKMFCNGAEEYSGENNYWDFVTNCENRYWKHTITRLELSGYKVVIDKLATNRFGEVVPDCYAIYEPVALLEDESQNKAKDRYFELDIELQNTYEEKLIDEGIVPPDYFSWRRPCYIGCEEEYGLTLPQNFYKTFL